MSYLRTGIREVRWLLVGGPLLGSLIFTACLSADSTTPGDGSTTGGATAGSDGTGTGTAGAQSGGTAGSGSQTTGVGGDMSGGVGGNMSGGVGGGATGGSTGAGGSGMTGSTVGKVAAGVRWVGRVDTTDPTKPKFSWGGAGFVAQGMFTGASMNVTLNNDQIVFFQPVVDGKVGMRIKATQGMVTIQVPVGAAGMHKVELYRETEANQGVTTLVGIAGVTLATPPMYSGRLIEAVGDSLTNGYGELQKVDRGTNCGMTVSECHYTPDTQSNYMSYVAIAGRALNADWSIVANSGWGLALDIDGKTNSLMPHVYEDAYFAGGTPPKWDFSVKADVVIVNLGTNDTSSGRDPTGYTAALVAFVGTVRTKYPTAWIFPVTGSMVGGATTTLLAKYINAAVTQLNDPKIFYQDLGTQDCTKGTGCDWHPDVDEHTRLANILIPVIKSKLGW
jgi:lysophospholipase L1-like esterase